MSARYLCCDEHRRAALANPTAPAGLSGIDYIEVTAGATTADPTLIDIVLVKPLSLPAAALAGANIAITGGVRFAAPRVDANIVEMLGAMTSPPGGPVDRYRVTVAGGQQTDYSTYRIALVTGPTDPTPPTFIDPRLAAVDFSFKIGCPSDFDCAPCDDGGEASAADPLFDYRVRDYPGFRRQLLDRLTALVPGFREDDPVDFTTTLVEAAAYLADQKSYRLDWVGTEAFLQTARSRASIARHARLLDYDIGEGASARLYAQFDFQPVAPITDGMPLAQGTPLLARIEGEKAVVAAARYRDLLAASPTVFETAAELPLWAWRNSIAFHTWSDDECMLPRGATAATLVDGSGPLSALAAGELLLLVETVSPETGEADDARPDRRHVVRLTRVASVTDKLAPAALKLVDVEWSADDALPFDLVIQAPKPGVIAGTTTQVCAEARGNVVLADHGASYPPIAGLGLLPADVERLTPRLSPPIPAEDEAWRPVLDRADVARVAPVDFKVVPAGSARSLVAVDPGAMRAALVLEDDFGPWTARPDLLRSGRYDRDFVIEAGIDGRPSIRFGDGVNGLAPAPESVLTPRGRFGSGIAGNIGTGALGHVVLPPLQENARIAVTNPLPGRGGAAPEAVSAIRIAAPQAFRTQERAVTEADYAAAAMRYPDVAYAIAIARWTGAWQTILVYIDRKEGRAVDAAFLAGLAEHLEFHRLMGFDVALRAAKPAPMDIELLICAKAGAIRSNVAARVREVLRPSGAPGGAPGFFHPDNFSFGTRLYASKLIAAVMAVEGVQSARLLRFQRLGRVAQGEIALGLIRPVDIEVLQLSDDPSFPENGKLSLVMGGGR
ncbi:MAG TPA: baseplate J/gp47 family protein [Allosphingosinicella sp.]|nr:baseplate J/gp47 family protein [Allosphingosinicella sp.]